MILEAVAVLVILIIIVMVVILNKKPASKPCINPDNLAEYDDKCKFIKCQPGNYIPTGQTLCQPEQQQNIQCSSIKSDCKGDACKLPALITIDGKTAGITFGDDKTPVPNFGSYKNVYLGDGTVYCQLDSCASTFKQNNWWCEATDKKCDSTTHDLDDNSHGKDASANWTYVYSQPTKQDDDTNYKCKFDSCFGGYNMDDGLNTCAQDCKDAKTLLPYPLSDGTKTPLPNTIYKNANSNNQHACVFDSCASPFKQHDTDQYCVPSDYGQEGCDATRYAPKTDTHVAANSVFTNDYLSDGTKVCKFENCLPNYKGNNCETAPFCTAGNRQSCSCTNPQATACIVKGFGSNPFYQSCVGDGSAYNECRSDWTSWDGDNSGTEICSQHNPPC